MMRSELPWRAQCPPTGRWGHQSFLSRTQQCWHPDAHLPASETGKCLLVQSSRPRHFPAQVHQAIFPFLATNTWVSIEWFEIFLGFNSPYKKMGQITTEWEDSQGHPWLTQAGEVKWEGMGKNSERVTAMNPEHRKHLGQRAGGGTGALGCGVNQRSFAQMVCRVMQIDRMCFHTPTTWYFNRAEQTSGFPGESTFKPLVPTPLAAVSTTPVCCPAFVP